MASKHQVNVTINGTPYSAEVEARTTLVDFLRGQCGLTGTHVGCEHGVCGACTILWNGRAVRSCIMLAVQVDGAELRTVEGLAGPEGELHPVQQAFMEEHGLQCGFCTPGFMLSIIEMLERHPNPTDEVIKDVLGGQICRCTGYQTIFEAVRNAINKVSNGQGAV